MASSVKVSRNHQEECLVQWGRCNKSTSLGGLSNKTFFFSVLEAGEAKIKVLTDLMSGKGPLPVLQRPVFLFLSPHGGKQKERHVSFLRTLIPFTRALPF